MTERRTRGPEKTDRNKDSCAVKTLKVLYSSPERPVSGSGLSEEDFFHIFS